MGMKTHQERIRDFHQRHKRLPTYREIMEVCGFRSTNAAHKLVQKLIERRVLIKDRAGKLAPAAGLVGGVRMLGLVEAGFPSPAEEELADTMSLDEFLVEKPDATYLLRVKGNSMVDAGIVEGDLVLVERTQQVKNGDIVIAEVDGEWTMKYFRKRGSRVYLEAANADYQPITPSEELKIAAKVVGVVRKY